MLDVLPCPSPSNVSAHTKNSFIHLIPVCLQLFLLGSQLTAPQLQFCLLLGWAWGKPVHYVLCSGHSDLCLPKSWRRSAPAEPLMWARATPPGTWAVASCIHLWMGSQGWQSYSCTDTHILLHRKDRAPHYIAHPKMSSRHDSLSVVEKIHLNGHFPPW